MLKELLLAIAITALVAVPANAEYLATLQANDTYTMTVTNGANNTDATGVVILAVSANGLTVLVTEFLRNTPQGTSFPINFTPPRRANAVIVQISPSRDGSGIAQGQFTLNSVINVRTQAVVVPLNIYTGDTQLMFEVVP